MIFVELFYHCDHHGCEAHAYVPGDAVAWHEDSHKLPTALPVGWRADCSGRVYCPKHGPGEAA